MDNACKLIFVIDDDDGVRDVLRDILEDEGYSVATAANGREALAQLRSLPQRPCMILLDLMMPIMDGWAFRREQAMDGLLGSIPTVVLSADANVIGKATTLNVSGHLRKPIRLNELLESVGAHCPP